MSIEEKKEDKRQAILKAAEEAFKGRRFDEVKLDEVAALAGVGKGTLYLYFKNKEDLFAALAGEGTNEMAERVLEISRMDVPYRERLFQFGREFSEFARERHAWMLLMQKASSADLEAKVRPQHDRVKSSVCRLLQTGIEEGVLREDVGVDALECLLVGSLFFRMRQRQRAIGTLALEPVMQCFWDAAKRK